jgi:beta-barrel assembly-enhancing protease
MTPPRVLLLLAVTALALSGCVTPNAGSAGRNAIDRATTNTTSVAKLTPKAQIGRTSDLKSDVAGMQLMADKVESGIQTSGNIVKDPALNAYMQTLVCKLSGPYCGDIRVYVLRVPYFNASMMPNGTLQVWSGLLLRSQNEAQLAAVLGHEIGHYLREHTIERMRNTIVTSNVLAFVQLAAAGAGVGVVGSVASLVAIAQQTAYSRDQEREADQYGHQILVEHGYDPRQAAVLWDQLIEERDTEESEEAKSLFLSTHPLPEDRSIALTALAEAADPDGKLTKIGAEQFHAVMQPLRTSFLWDELHLRRYDRFQTLLSLVAKSKRRLGEVYFFQGELQRLRNDTDDMESARNWFNKALKAGGTPVEIHRSLGQTHQKIGDDAAAKAAFQKYLDLNPSAKDAKMIRYILGTFS